MESKNNKLIEWTIKQAETTYKDKISIMTEHTTYMLEQDSSLRYVNTFISESKSIIGLARTFIINGIGYDLWQNPWESFEKKADLKDYYITSLADSTIVYYKSEEDKQRFLSLQKKLQANLENPSYMYERGLEWLSNAMELYQTMMFEDALYKVRKASGYIADYLAVSVACINQTYYKSVMTQISQLRTMKKIPKDFIELSESIAKAKTVDELKHLCHELIQNTRTLFKSLKKGEIKSNNNPDYAWLASWYQECCYYLRRIYYYCDENNPTVAFKLTCGIQADLDDISVDFGISGLDILSHFNAEKLADFAKQVKIAEHKIVSAIEENGVKIDSYATVEEFVQNN